MELAQNNLAAAVRALLLAVGRGSCSPFLTSLMRVPTTWDHTSTTSIYFNHFRLILILIPPKTRWIQRYRWGFLIFFATISLLAWTKAIKIQQGMETNERISSNTGYLYTYKSHFSFHNVTTLHLDVLVA